MSAADDILTAAKAVCPAFHAGKVPTGQQAPYAVLHSAPYTPNARQLDGLPANRATIHRLIVVSNNSRGAAILADAVTRAVDGTPSDGHLLMVTYASPPIRDDTDLSAVWWTSTLEITHHI